MAENPQEFSRKVVNEFKAADALLSSRLKFHENTALVRSHEIKEAAQLFEFTTADCITRIKHRNVKSVDFPKIEIPDQIDRQIKILKNYLTDIKHDEEALDEIHRRIASLEKDLHSTLQQEKTDLETKHLQDLLNRKKRQRAMIATAILVLLLVALGFIVWRLNSVNATVFVLENEHQSGGQQASQIDVEQPKTESLPVLKLSTPESSVVAETSIFQKVLFSDDFSNVSASRNKWRASGESVVEAHQMMEVLTTKMDAGGNLKSVPFAIGNVGLITISRQVFLHHDDGVSYNGQSHFFNGQFAIKIDSLPAFSMQYADMDYADGSNLIERHGFFMVRNDASAISASGQANGSTAIRALWDTWFDEKITYDPVTGLMKYFINNTSQGTFYVGVLPQSDSPTMMISVNAWGWYTGHQQLFKNLIVTQETNSP